MPRAGYQAYQPLDMTGRRSGVYARPIIEVVDDVHCAAGDTDHEWCLVCRVAARWPTPNPGQEIEHG